MGWSLRVLRHRAAAQRTLLVDRRRRRPRRRLAARHVRPAAVHQRARRPRTPPWTGPRRPPPTSTPSSRWTPRPTRPPRSPPASRSSTTCSATSRRRARQWLTSPMYRLVGQGGRVPPLSYLAANPAAAVGRHPASPGAWPTAATDDQGRVEVAVPKVAADAYGWIGRQRAGRAEPGDLRRTPGSSSSASTSSTGPSSIWTRDLLQGAEHDPSYPVPGQLRLRHHRRVGPVRRGPGRPRRRRRPGDRGPRRLPAPHRRTRRRGRRPALPARRRAGVADRCGRATSRSPVPSARPWPTTIDVAEGNLAVTRVSLVIVGLMLVVLAVTVLLLAARLLADRRAAEQTLMSSRGASGRQLLRPRGARGGRGRAGHHAGLAVARRAAVRAHHVVRPARARRACTPTRAGRVSLWVTCVVASFVLAGVLLGPAPAPPGQRRRHRAAAGPPGPARRPRAVRRRPGAGRPRRAWRVWQLQTYRSPVVAGARARPDPRRGAGAAAPRRRRARAAGAPAGRRRRRAARGPRPLARRARWPPGRWVGGRPARRARCCCSRSRWPSARSRSRSSATWRTSQADQVDLQVGTDVRVSRLNGAAIAQADGRRRRCRARRRRAP